MERFPHNVLDDDRNPSIRLFGRRFSNDLQPLNVLAELLLVIASEKKFVIADSNEFVTSTIFPDAVGLRQLREEATGLAYCPKARLNLKLFSFLGASSLSTRHQVHQEHARELRRMLAERIDTPSRVEAPKVLQDLSAVFLGFLGNGAGRTWCAQTFLPFHPSLLCGEVIWRSTNARQRRPEDWRHVCREFSQYFETNKHRFLDRSGESLYLQLCNAFSRTRDDVNAWLNDENDLRLALRDDETDPEVLAETLSESVRKFLDSAPKGLAPVLDFVDTGVDSETAEASDGSEDAPRRVECGWVPAETWREGYLFAVEVKRLLLAKLDLMEKLDLFEVACSLQIMRTLVRQACRHSGIAPLRLLLCDAGGVARKLKMLSARSFQEITKVLKLAIRTPDIMDEVRALVQRECQSAEEESKMAGIYREADAYGCGLYRKIGKSLGLIVPPRGRSMKGTLNERLLRCLVLTLVSEKRTTLSSFKKRIEAHHGFVFDPADGEGDDAWLERMLEAAGMLVRLSDACSLVLNPFA